MSNVSRKELSDRERQLLELAAAGSTDTQIARELGISEATVATYWGRVRTKLGPLNRSELVAIHVRAQSRSLIEELRKRNAALLERLSQRDTDQETESDAKYYRSLLNQAPDAMLIVDAEGLIESANQAALELFGYEEEGLDGKKVDVLIPDRYHDVHSRHRQTYWSHPDRQRMGQHLSTVGLHRLGREFAIAATLAPVESPSGMRVVCAIRAAEVERKGPA